MVNERRRQTRYNASERVTVYDHATDKPIGLLANLSARGAMFVTSVPVREDTVFQCRVDLNPPIMGQNSFVFKAECQWSRKNIKAGQWESGYRLEVTGVDAELIQYLMLNFRLEGYEAEDIPDVKTIEMKNRRESVRYEFHKTLSVFEYRSYRQIGDLADLSLRGMRLFSSRPLKKGGSLRCRVKLPREIFRQDFLTLETRCMWSTPTSDNQTYESGHRIVKIERPDEVILLYLLIHYGRAQSASRQIKVVT